jgi:hypothetical protein
MVVTWSVCGMGAGCTRRLRDEAFLQRRTGAAGRQPGGDLGRGLARGARLLWQGGEHDALFRNLCRRLGFGLIAVSASGALDVILEPLAATPRRDPKRRSRLLSEHRRRVGDPKIGGGRGKPIMTAYRQDCILCATSLLSGPQSPKKLKTRVARAPTILQSNVYGWFFRESRGIYGLTELRKAAVLPSPD